jgi:hypothetical protein
MSEVKLPKKIRVPSLSKEVDATTPAHSELLTLSWAKLDSLVSAIYGRPEESFQQQERAAQQSFLERCRKDSELARSHANKPDNQAIQSELLALAQRIDEASRIKVPPIPRTAPVARIKKLQQPIEHRDKLVGFIDIECIIDVPVCQFADNSVCAFLHQPGINSKSSWTERQIKLALAVDLGPKWEIETKQKMVWIDIRTIERPVGLLLRELKTLRAYGPQDILVVGSVEAGVSRLLTHEGFHVVTKEFLDSLTGSLSEQK